MKFEIDEVPAFYQNYIRQVGNAELVPLLLRSGDELVSTCKDLTEERALFRYAPAKWSIKDLVQHLIDSERIFSYRAMRFARNDATELSGFEEGDFAREAHADGRTLHQLLTEFTNLRASTIDMFSSFDEKARERRGISNKVEMSVEMIGYIISGHTLHHLQIINERYLK